MSAPMQSCIPRFPAWICWIFGAEFYLIRVLQSAPPAAWHPAQFCLNDPSAMTSACAIPDPSTRDAAAVSETSDLTYISLLFGTDPQLTVPDLRFVPDSDTSTALLLIFRDPQPPSSHPTLRPNATGDEIASDIWPVMCSQAHVRCVSELCLRACHDESGLRFSKTVEK